MTPILSSKPSSGDEAGHTPRGKRVLSLWKGEMLVSRSVGEGRYDIARRVARRHGVSMDELRSPSKVRHLVEIRQEAWVEMAETGRWSLVQMAMVFDRRDHTTVRCALASYERRAAA